MNYFGEDTFYYIFKDGEGNELAGRVTVSVASVLDPATLLADEGEGLSGGIVLINALENDMHPEGFSFEVTGVGNGSIWYY